MELSSKCIKTFTVLATKIKYNNICNFESYTGNQPISECHGQTISQIQVVIL